MATKTQTRRTGTSSAAKDEVRFTLPDARRSLYVSVGAADFAVEKLRALPSLQGQLVGGFRTQVKDLQTQVRELPQALRTSLNGLQDRVTGTYSDLAGRGERVVSNIRKDPTVKSATGQVKTAKAQVKAARTSVKKAAVETGEAADSAGGKIG